ncbi:MAG: Mrp/NBP35 family ATP-binding protein, partial [Balneolaceae bacterium]
NLAVSLAKQGYNVGLMDTDIYGPSVPTMFGVKERPNITTDKKLVPIQKHGVHLVSMGFLVDTDQAMIWRGPMVTSAVKQFMQEVRWPELDYLILDLPPGTGDIQLTIVQTVPLTGAVIVSTPQTVALDDARKGVAMFNKVNVPVLGIIENMAYFTPPDMPEKKYYIFGKHGARKLAQKLEVPFLGEVALQENIRDTSDRGTPVVEAEPDSPAAESFTQIAERVKNALISRYEDQESTEKIEINIRP